MNATTKIILLSIVLLLSQYTSSFGVNIPSNYNTGIDAVPEDIITVIAKKQAEQLWGDVALGPVIPMVDIDQYVIAYYVVFAIGQGRFPDLDNVFQETREGRIRRTAIIERINQETEIKQIPQISLNSASIAREFPELADEFEAAVSQAWGIGKYGTVLMSARYTMRPIPEYFEGLPRLLTLGDIAQELAENRLNDVPNLNHIYFAGRLQQTYEFSSHNERIYIDPYPNQEIDSVQFIMLNSQLNSDCETDSSFLRMVRSEWDSLYTKPFADRAIIEVPHRSFMPKILWTGGCAPTAASMVASYWDNKRNSSYYVGYGRIIDWYKDEYEYPCTGGGSLQHNIPNILDEFRSRMSTDCSGNTSSSNMRSGIEQVLNIDNNYSFNVIETQSCIIPFTDCWDWCWGEITEQINDGYPFVWAVTCTNCGGTDRGHALAAWGYNDSNKKIGVYNTWDEADHWWCYNKYGNNCDWDANSTWVFAMRTGGSEAPNDIKLFSPQGGESWTACTPQTISWYQYGSSITQVSLLYSKNGGASWFFIQQNLSSTGEGPHSYTWTPTNSHTGTLTRIKVYGLNGSGQRVAADGSYGNFTINSSTGPVSNFSGTPRSGCQPLNVCFTDQSTGNPTSWSWNFGDGATSTLQNPCHNYTSAGSYTVSLTASNSCGTDTETKSAYIVVNDDPVANFGGTPRSGCQPLNVCFTDQSTGNPTSWSWNFGDGGTSSQQNPCHTYNNPGTYTVTLTVSNTCGSDSETKSNYIVVNPKPVADFSGSPRSGCQPLTVCFNDQSSGNPTSWSWNFGDGGNSSQQNPCHTYSNPGTYNVTLTVSNTCGSDSETKSNYIVVNPKPIAAFTGSPTNGCAPLNVCFTDQSTGNPTSWSWNFGDGGTSSQQNPCHTYNNPGTYTVTLTVSNICGSDSETKSNYIVVNPNLVAAFTGSPTNGCEPLNVCFTDQSTGSPISWNWNFGDGGTSSQQNPCHTYNSPGTFTVTLTVSNTCGSDPETKSNYIVVNPKPVAAFTCSPTNGCEPLNVCFTDQSTGNPTSWSWNFGDGGTSSQQNPCHTYNNDGTYSVTLTVSNSCGSDVETKSSYIIVNQCDSLIANFTADPTEGCAPLNICFTDQSSGDPTSWSWDFGDGGSSSEQNPCHIYSDPGTYTVSLTISDGAENDTATKTDYITVHDPGVAAFSATPLTGCPTLNVQFNDGSTGEIDGWLWDFGDGDTSTEQNPLHLYVDTGTYTVNLTVTGPCDPDTHTEVDYIDVRCGSLDIQGCIAYFDQLKVVPDVTVSLTGTAIGTEYTDLTGCFQFVGLEQGPYTLTPNRPDDDPSVSVGDVIKIRRHLAGLEPFTSGYQYLAADVYMPPPINVGDVIKIRRYLAGLEPLPEGNWKFPSSDFPIDSNNYWLAPLYRDTLIIGADITGVDFIGIRMGDVNASWPSPFAVSGNYQGTISLASTSVTLPTVTAEPDQVTNLPIAIQGEGTVAGFELHLNYESAKITIVSINGNTLVSDLTTNITDDNIHIVWDDITNPINLSGKMEIINIGFIANEFFIDTAKLEFESAILVDDIGDPLSILTVDGGIICSSPTLVENQYDSNLPLDFKLEQNYPNPFNPDTYIRFYIPRYTPVEVSIYNMLGQKVRTLLNKDLSPGHYQLEWNAIDDYGNSVSSGIYMCILKADKKIETKRMILLK